MADLGSLNGIEVSIVGRITYPDGRESDHVLAEVGGTDYRTLAQAIEDALNEIANTWPEVIRGGVL